VLRTADIVAAFGFSTVWKNIFHTVEKVGKKVPRCGKVGPVFSTQWKKFQRFFHTMEQLCGNFSTLWKNGAKKFHAMEKLLAIFPRNGK
jgi:hypothetical protein